MKKKTIGLLVLALSGCHYYQGNAAPDQSSSLSWPDPITYEKTYPFVEIYNPIEVERMIDDPNDNGSCQFQTFSAFWEYYHDQFADTETLAQKILNQSACSLSHFGAIWLETLLCEDKKNWNKGLITLAPLLQSPGHPFYAPALGLSHRLQTSRTTSISDLSPEEVENIEAQKNLLRDYQADPEDTDFFYNIVIIAGKTPAKEFFESLIIAFEKQSAIESIHIFSQDSPRSDIIRALQLPQTVLIGYYLSQPLPKDYLMESQASITIGEDFVKHRDTDYWICDPILQMLQSVRYDPFCVDPQIIFYEEGFLSPKLVKFLEKQKIMINITELTLSNTLSNILALPQREETFQKAFSKKIHYLAQPKLLPHTILCLVRPETLRILNTQILSQGQSKILLLADPRLLSGESSLDKAFKGVLFFTHPFDKSPKMCPDYMLGADLIEIVRRLPRFSKEGSYIYHGNMGAYFLKNQQIRAQRWWTRY